MKSITLSCTLGLTLCSAASALEIAPLQTGYIYDLPADVDAGGEISKHFFHASGGAPLYSNNDDLFLALTASYQLHSYDFSGSGSFTGLNPWNDVHIGNLGAFIRWGFADNWELFALPSIRTSGESGANFSDTLTGSALAGASYKFSDTLTIGPGIGYVGQIEDSASIFPILLIDWQFAEQWSITTGPVVGASLGPGLAVRWDIQEHLRFTFGARSERIRFRLDDSSSSAKQGIGEDNSIPVFGILTWQATEHLQTSFIAGVGFANDLVLDDSNGDRISRKDYDPSPFVGINLGYSF
ncbi:hypothetical protein ACFPK9_04265 [Rubritalea spongiae]|uniref:Outer membrane protein beta-barrel domain-containing protein n=1 Tax=Rubritalea spongiae TaxID=430797 RepID=A0ABW5E605_9BACT